MRLLVRRISLMVVAVVMALGISIPVYAAPTTTVTADNKASAEEYIKSSVTVDSNGNLKYSSGTLRAYLKEAPDKTHTNQVVIGDNKIVYYDSSSLTAIAGLAAKTAANGKVGEKVNDIQSGIGIEANTGAAATMLSGFKPILELVIGIIVVLISFGMTLFSSVDICYIAFPVFRNKMEDSKQSGNSVTTKKSANGDVQLRFVSDDAQYAITQGTIDSGKSPWVLYFKKRIMSYIFLGIILFILLTGNITLITNIAVGLVSGIIDILTSLA